MVQTRRWWQGRRGGNRVMLLVLGLVAFAFMVFNASGRLTAGDQRQVVARLVLPATDAQREAVKDACGRLPGVALVPDQGAADKQRNLPVRFDVAGITQQQEVALYACLEERPEVRYAGPEAG